jgi:hypothetical protein
MGLMDERSRRLTRLEVQMGIEDAQSPGQGTGPAVPYDERLATAPDVRAHE